VQTKGSLNRKKIMLRYILSFFSVMLSLSVPATAQVYCYSPITQSCFISRESFCPIDKGIPVSRAQCADAEERHRPSSGPRCCYYAGTGRKYITRSECGALEQDIGLEACNRQPNKVTWCYIVQPKKVFTLNTGDCPYPAMTITEDQARILQ
jgi:hypothetical protein